MRYEIIGHSRKIINSYPVDNMSHTLSMMPTGIHDPTFIKRKVFLATDTGNDHRRCFFDGWANFAYEQVVIVKPVEQDLAHFSQTVSNRLAIEDVFTMLNMIDDESQQ